MTLGWLSVEPIVKAVILTATFEQYMDQYLRAHTWSGHDAPRPTARQNMLPSRDSRLRIVARDHKELVGMLGLSRFGHNGHQC